jgi:glucuronate isomerase
MKKFMDENFLLQTKAAQTLYHDHAKGMPIIDFHNHLNPQEIYEDRQFSDISTLWLAHDHYKWRALRAFGMSEDHITGTADAFTKFSAYAKMMPYAIGNPLFHWTHLELQRYFGIDEVLSEQNARAIYDKCNALLRFPEYSVRNLLLKMNVEALCTTDDPLSDLQYHKVLKQEGFAVRVLPTFRPERAMALEKEDFIDYIAELATYAPKQAIRDIKDVEAALYSRMRYFHDCGCRISDHSLEREIFAQADPERADAALQKALTGAALSAKERCDYKGYLLSFLGKAYHELGWVMQLHIGALRNNSERMFARLGADTGYDSMDDFNYARQLSGLLSELDLQDQLPKTILYCLNPKDNAMMVTMMANFQGGGQRGKMQFGAAWWFLDQKEGMINQLEALAGNGLLANFVGMVTDSRSFLSFPRHEYFRRLLCDYLGQIVERGEYPYDLDFIGGIVEDICYNNIKSYLLGEELGRE